jgi:uncharacterized protein YjbI with pentapeptide repeats
MPGAKIFLSYKHNHSRSDVIRRQLEAELIQHGYDVLVDETLRGGDRWPTRLYEWVLECAAAVVLASPEAKASDWCQREWHVLAARAAASGTRVIPVCIDLPPSELTVLEGLQAIEASDDLVTRVLAALADVPSWAVTPEDYLALHQAWNRYQFWKGPVLGREPFALQQIYLETECGVLRWSEISSPGVIRDPFEESNGGRTSIVDTVMDLVLDPDFRDALVVQGPAGSGKSAFTLRLADALEAKRLRAVRLRFRDMRFATHDRVDEMFADAIRVGPESEVAPAPVQELFDEARLRDTVQIAQTTLCRWVFILDGWDEVSLAGSAGYQAQLRTWLPKIREFLVQRTGAPVRLVITGRPSLEVKESGFLRRDTPILTLRPIRPDQLRAFADAVSAVADWGLTVERCEAACKRYTTWFERREPNGIDMLGLPLLAFLTFRTLADWRGDIAELISAPSALYCALIDQTVTHSGKAVAEGLEGTVHRGGESLRRLLVRTAAIVSVFWSEHISFEELKLRLDEERALEEWVESATADHPLHELVVNFYFKGGHPELGCEFLHKSFREYLFAEAIVNRLEEVAEQRSGSIEPPQRSYWKDFEEGSLWYRASRELSKLLAPQWFTPEIRGHVFWLLSRAIAANPGRWTFLRDLLADVYAWWAEGVHLRPQPKRERGRHRWEQPYVFEMVEWSLPYTDPEAEPMRLVALDGHLGYALIQLAAFVHAQLPPSTDSPVLHGEGRYQYDDGTRRCFRPGNGGYFKHIAARWATVLMPFWVRLALPRVVLADEPLAHVDLSGADLGGANLTRADLSGANLWEADLGGANLTRANLSGANLWEASLRVASLREADLREADLSGANLSGADLREANLTRADLSGANLTRADLSGANLTRADLIRANLSGANLIRANLWEADLREASLREADLREADLREANLREANLREASLSGANLSGADLREANLTRANLSGANLTEAKNLTQDQLNTACGDEQTKLPLDVQVFLP